jgi:CubicO group peptidase (beta-lactamase class C family)
MITRPILAVFAGAFLWASAHAAESTDQQVDELFAEWNKSDSPGAVVGVIRNGEWVYQQSYGLANIETGTRLTPDSVFYLASVGKQFTAFAIALLQADGKLDVDDDIRKTIPEMPDYGSTITIRHLLHHTSGIRDYLGLMQVAGLPLGYFHHDQDVVDLIARQKALNFTPGDRYLYSNSGYFLLAVIVHRVSGKTLREFANERMFGPLEMSSSHFHDEYTHPIKNRAASYYNGDDGELDVFLSTFDRVGSGGVYGSLNDLIRWDQNFYDAKVGGQQVIDWMHQTKPLNGGTDNNYAWGISHGEHRGLKTVQHSGALGGYRTILSRVPEHRFSVVILANHGSINTGQLAQQIATIYLEEHLEEPAVPSSDSGEPSFADVAPDQLKPLTGLYFSDDLGLVRRILLRDRQLIYSRGEDEEAQTPLGALGEDQFRMVGVPLNVNFDRHGNTMTVGGDGEPPSSFIRVEPAKDVRLADFAGHYYSEEVDVTVEIKPGEAGLEVHHPRNRDEPLPFEASASDLFVNPEIGTLAFQRDKKGTITRFTLEAGRIRGLGFERTN